MHAHGWGYRITLACISLAVEALIAACGVAAHATTQGRSFRVASSLRVTAAANRQAARRDARVLLRRAILPAGAVRVWSEPVGDDGALALPAQVPGVADFVDLHGWWRLSGSVRSVYRFIKAHHPPGARLDGWGRRYPRPTAAFVDLQFSALPAVFESRDLNIEIASLPGHAVGVRVDSQIVWTFPRPASERLPSGIRSIRIIREQLGHQRRQTATINSPIEVNRLVAIFNRLPIEQPGSILSCPIMPPQPVIIFRFLPSPLAQATYTGNCGGTELRINGRLQHPLEGVSGAVRIAQRLTGLRLIPHARPLA
jgi:hypothetical protein